jgi:mono/diheme cytochrome c family protein
VNEDAMNRTTITIAVAVLFGGGAIAAASGHGRRGEHHEDGDDHERHGRGHHGERARGATGAAADPEGLALYRKECGACHLAFPPHFLPAESHRSIMAGLERHFDQNAELDAAVRGRIERYLVDNAAGAGSDRARSGRAPARITELVWFRKKHREIDAKVTARPSVRSFSNCAACHAGAASWDFDDDRVMIPAD